jgi:DNA polymerase
MANIDFETYSEAGFVWDAALNKWAALPGAPQGKKGLPVVGSSVYVEHPAFEVLCLSYDLKDGRSVQRWKPGDLPPDALFAHIQRGGYVSGWNSGGFEVKVWDWCARNLGWPSVPISQWRDAMANARASSLPGALAKAAEVLGGAQQKNKDGKRLLDKFSIPRNPTKTNQALRIRPVDDPADAEQLYAYCDQDVRTEQDIGSHVPDLPASELEIWQCDRAINDRGVQMDVAGIENCIVIINQAHARYNAELVELTGGTVSKASELQKLIGWLGAQGVHTDSLDEEHLDELLANQSLPWQARRALEIRAAIGSASVKKVFAMRNMVSADGRLRDLFVYYGARTGRVTGGGPQPTNLPNSAGVFAYECECCERHFGTHTRYCPWCGASLTLTHKVEWSVESAEHALETIASRDYAFVEYIWGDAMLAVSGCIRALFIAAEGKDLLCSDYSSIEAVVIAELAGEDWRRDLFRTHGKIYEMSAAKISGVSFDEFMTHAGYTAEQLAMPEWWTQKPAKEGAHHPLRKKIGKVAELASGYQGWIGSWCAFGADEFMTEPEMKDAILAWRAASPMIVEFWGGQQRNWKTEYYGVEGMMVQAILNPGHSFEYRGHRFQMRGDVAYLRLVSGRELAYHRPRLADSTKRSGTYSISYEGWNSNPKNGPVGWIRMDTWGGRLVENIVQATARDIQWHGILNLERAGYPVVLHVYDEDIAEVPEGFGSIEEFEYIMAMMPPWAADWPIKAKGGWRGKRYRK